MYPFPVPVFYALHLLPDSERNRNRFNSHSHSRFDAGLRVHQMERTDRQPIKFIFAPSISIFGQHPMLSIETGFGIEVDISIAVFFGS